MTTTALQPSSLDRLGLLLADIAAEDAAALPTPLQGQRIQELLRLRHVLDGAITGSVRAFDAGKGAAASGALSTAAWLRSTCRLGPGAAAELVRVGRQLPELPGFEQALATGEVSFAHAAVATRCIEEVGLKVARQAEPDLLEAARQLHPPHLRRVTRHLRHCVDPEGALAEAVRQEQGRYLHLSPSLDDVWYVEGRLDPEGGALLATALEAVAGPPRPDDRRSAAQRRADALVDLVAERLGSGDLPSTGGQRPHLLLMADLPTLQRQPGSRAAELDWGQCICGESARRLACDAALTPILVDEHGEPLSVGRASRVIPPGMRRALVLRDRSCRWPGCGRPATWCDAHHLQSWLDGGATKLSNLALLCRAHHRLVHDGGWRLVRTPGGELEAIPPAPGSARGP